eukprot:6217257-Alexandrium_andersonii.AAC.1
MGSPAMVKFPEQPPAVTNAQSAQAEEISLPSLLGCRAAGFSQTEPVSYTHLTLPTICSV